MDKRDEKDKRNFGGALLFILGCLLPLIIIFILSGLGYRIGPWVFILILLICPLLLHYLIGHGEEREEEPSVELEAEHTSDMKTHATPDIQEMEALFSWDIFFVKETRTAGDAVIFEGNLRAKPEKALDVLRGRFRERFGNKYEILLQQDAEEKPVIVAIPMKEIHGKEKTTSPFVHIILFVATVVTTTVAGASHQGINLFLEPSQFKVGLPYAFGIMAILGIHELSHYIFARRHGIDTTLPYFIPIPFGLGTFGALIQMRSLVKDRKALFDTGIAGPLAGLIVAIPLLFIGLKYSTVIQDGSEAGVSISSSVLLAFIASLSMGSSISVSHTVLLHPLAFASWIGLMITALNLLPIGQLDGGHMSYAVFGRKRAEIIAHVAFFAIIILGIFVWSGWFMWAIIVYFLSGFKSMPPANDITDVDRRRVIIGAVTFVLLFLIISPLPHVFYKSLGLHCPYV